MKLSYLFIFLGGGLGSMCRYALSDWSNQKFQTDFPIGTFLSNMIASLAFGLIAGYMFKNSISEQLSLFLLAGFCGGFSTFSTFSKENFFLMQQGQYWLLSSNLLLSIAFGILCFFVGWIIMR